MADLDNFLISKVRIADAYIDTALHDCKVAFVEPPIPLIEAKQDIASLLFNLPRGYLESASDKADKALSKVASSLSYLASHQVSIDFNAMATLSLISRSLAADTRAETLIELGGKSFRSSAQNLVASYDAADINEAKNVYYLADYIDSNDAKGKTIYEPGNGIGDINIPPGESLIITLKDDEPESALTVYINQDDDVLSVALFDDNDSTLVSMDTNSMPAKTQTESLIYNPLKFSLTDKGLEASSPKISAIVTIGSLSLTIDDNTSDDLRLSISSDRGVIAEQTFQRDEIQTYNLRP